MFHLLITPVLAAVLSAPALSAPVFSASDDGSGALSAPAGSVEVVSGSDGSVALSAPAGSVEPDSTRYAALDASLEQYFKALNAEPADVKCEEVDFIISSCTDSTVLEYVANRVYGHYIESNLMGDDAVAVHVFDKWFADGAVKMEGEGAFFAAEFFARANRNSLIGRPAPKLELLDPDNRSVVIFGDPRNDLAGRHAILFFYDVGCPKCLVESIMLRNLLQEHDYRLVMYTVYVGSDAEKWAEYREQRFDSIDAPGVEIVHLWDPELASGFTLEYGVFSTPKIFLVGPDGTIVGRSLDGASLEELLESVYAPKILEYGSDESVGMYEKAFEDTGPTDCGAVSRVARQIADRLLPMGDTLLYKQMTGDLLYFLTSRKEAVFKCGTEEFIDNYILSREDVWNTADDSLKVVNLAVFLKQLLNLSPVGSNLPGIEAPAEVLRVSGGRVKSKTETIGLDKLKDCAILFYTEGCRLCEAERKAAPEVLAAHSALTGTDFRPSRIVLVDMDEVWGLESDLAERLMQWFDLSSLPFILCVDGSGAVSHKYVTFL